MLKAWTSLDEDAGLSSYREIKEEEVPWLFDAYINQYKKTLRAIQFLNDDILILMSTNTIDDIDEYSEYINNHTNSMANQLHATADIDINPEFTIIIISKEKLSVIKNAVNCAFMGRWPD